MGSKFEDEYLLRADGVTKRYGELRAVDEVSLEIRPGEIFALLGPNGAGKTTLIGCITGLISGFEGKINIAGFDVVDDYQITRRLVGLVPQELNYDAFFTARQVLEFQAGYFGVRPTRERIEELLEKFSLLDKADANTRWLSGGMKRRLMICKALLHEPVLLFLDEPTAGVDVDLRDELWTYVEALRDEGTTIVLTTHYLEEAEKLADRVGIINKGRLLRVDPRESLMEEFGQRHLDITFEKPRAGELVGKLVGFDVESVDERTLRLHYGTDDSELSGPAKTGAAKEPVIDRLLRALLAEGVTISQMAGGRSSLEEIFRRVLREDVEQSDEEGR